MFKTNLFGKSKPSGESELEEQQRLNNECRTKSSHDRDFMLSQIEGYQSKTKDLQRINQALIEENDKLKDEKKSRDQYEKDRERDAEHELTAADTFDNVMTLKRNRDFEMYNDLELHDMLVKAGNDINKVYSNEVYNPIQVGTTIPVEKRRLPKRIALGGKRQTKIKRRRPTKRTKRYNL